MPSERKFVYSTDPDWCAKCGKIPCGCKPSATPVSKAAKQVAKLRLDRSGRRGKEVTVVFNLTLEAVALKELLRTLQRLCGTGGTLRDGTIEIQGDHRDRVEALLQEQGLSVKRSGG